MKKILSAIALALTLTLVVPVAAPQTAVVASAATKTKKTTLSRKSATIAICGTKTISLKNKNSKASYSFSSNKKSVATVSSKGVVTGKAAGTAKITVKQKLKGKTTTVGTFKVTVKKAQMASWAKYRDFEQYVSAQPGFITENHPDKLGSASQYIEYRNPKAKYFWYTDGKDLVVQKDGTITEVKGIGWTKVYVKETYQGKTRIVGYFELDMREPYIWIWDEDSLEFGKLYMGSRFSKYLDDYVQCDGKWKACVYSEKQSDLIVIGDANQKPDEQYDIIGDAANLVQMEKDEEGSESLTAKAPGTVYVYFIQYNYKTNTYDKVLGDVSFEIPDTTKLSSFDWSITDAMYDLEDDVIIFNKSKNQVDLSPNDYIKTFDIGIVTKPEKYGGTFEVINNSDPSVVEAGIKGAGDYDDDFIYTYLHLIPSKAGTSKITVSSGGIEKTLTVVVHPSGDYDYDYDDEEDW